MSLILDALRGRPRSTERSTLPRRTVRADAVLATLGYPKRRSPFETGRFVFYALIVIALGVLAWGLHIWYSIPIAQQ